MRHAPGFVSLVVAVAACVPPAGVASRAPSSAKPAVGEVRPQRPRAARPMDVRGASSALDEPGRAGPSGVPVLAFHQICLDACGPRDTYGMTGPEFLRTLRMLGARGYATLAIADYARWLAGNGADLPARAVLVTFDDSRTDAYRGADEALLVTGTRATMFAITAAADAENPFHMSWAELARAQASGRWDIQLHAHRGHVQIPAGPTSDGGVREGAFYANRRFDPSAFADDGHLEPRVDYRARVLGDLEAGVAALRRHLPGYAPVAFAVPFGDYGQKGSNDPEAARFLRGVLDERFAVWFTQPSDRPPWSRPAGGTHERARFTVYATTTADTIAVWLDEREASAR